MFLIFKDPSHIQKFSYYLNTQHPNIKFTYEVEKDNQLPFLDVLITNHFTNLSTEVYHKPIFTGLGINFRSYIPYIYKINSIKTLLHRAYSTTSTWLAFHNEASFLGKYFHNKRQETYSSNIIMIYWRIWLYLLSIGQWDILCDIVQNISGGFGGSDSGSSIDIAVN